MASGKYRGLAALSWRPFPCQQLRIRGDRDPRLAVTSFFPVTVYFGGLAQAGRLDAAGEVCRRVFVAPPQEMSRNPCNAAPCTCKLSLEQPGIEADRPENTGLGAG